MPRNVRQIAFLFIYFDSFAPLVTHFENTETHRETIAFHKRDETPHPVYTRVRIVLYNRITFIIHTLMKRCRKPVTSRVRFILNRNTDVS